MSKNCQICFTDLPKGRYKYCSIDCAKIGENMNAVNRNTKPKPYSLKNAGLESIEQWQDLKNKQLNLCASCHEPEGSQKPKGKQMKLATDHDHDTGEHRGLLCMRCNMALGLLKDSSTYIQSLLNYRNKYHEQGIKIIYVSGPITGYDKFNFPMFFDIATELRAAGYIVVNPAENDGPTLEIAIENATNNSRGSWEDYMAIDITRMMKCDAIVVLPGWRQSKGACWEVDIMRRLKRPVLRWDGALKPLVSVVGLSGYAGSGKDTAATLLKPYGFDRRAFADILRDCLYALDPAIEIVKDFYENSSFNDYYKLGRLKDRVDRQGWQDAKIDSLEIRTLLQKMGTELGRNILGENIWVDTVMKSLEDGHNYVFTDCRFPNEAAAVKKYGGKMIRINRPGFGPVNNHPSETSLDDYEFDVVVDNDGDLLKLTTKLLAVIND